MDTRNEELSQLQSYVEEIDNEVTMLLQNLQWDRKGLIENTLMVTCKHDIGHRVPADKKEMHERDCFMRKEGYSKDEKLLPDPFDPTAKSLIQLSNEDIKQIIVNASKSDPLFKIGWGSRDSAPSQTLGRLQATYTSDERGAIHAAVVKAAPSCHDLADLASTSTNVCERRRVTPKSRQEVLAELRDMRRRRTKYRGAATTGNYSDVLRGVITSQMELLTNPNAADEPGDQTMAQQKEEKKITFTIRKEATLPTMTIKPNSKIAKVDENIDRNITIRTEPPKEKSKRQGSRERYSRESSGERTRERARRGSSRERSKRKYSRERYEIDDPRNKSMDYSKQRYKGDYSRDRYKRGHSREMHRRHVSKERCRRSASRERYREDNGSNRYYNNKQNRNPQQWGNMDRHRQQDIRDRYDNRFRGERVLVRREGKGWHQNQNTRQDNKHKSRDHKRDDYDRGNSSNYRNGNRRSSRYESNERQSKRRRRNHTSEGTSSDSRSSSQSRSSSISESRTKTWKCDRKRKTRDVKHANKDKRWAKRGPKESSSLSKSTGSRSYSESGSSPFRNIKKERISSDSEIEKQRGIEPVNLNVIEMKPIKKEERSVSCSSKSSWE